MSCKVYNFVQKKWNSLIMVHNTCCREVVKAALLCVWLFHATSAHLYNVLYLLLEPFIHQNDDIRNYVIYAMQRCKVFANTRPVQGSTAFELNTI